MSSFDLLVFHGHISWKYCRSSRIRFAVFANWWNNSSCRGEAIIEFLQMDFCEILYFGVPPQLTDSHFG
jgi:hypothetical protein